MVKIKDYLIMSVTLMLIYWSNYILQLPWQFSGVRVAWWGLPGNVLAMLPVCGGGSVWQVDQWYSDEIQGRVGVLWPLTLSRLLLWPPQDTVILSGFIIYTMFLLGQILLQQTVTTVNYGCFGQSIFTFMLLANR